MKVVEINSVPYGSTGHIAKNICDVVNRKQDTCYFAYSWTKCKKNNVENNEILIGSFLEKLISIFLERLTGYSGHFSYFSTKIFVSKLKKIEPDIVHLHNLHEGYINYKILFKYLYKENINVVWTLHDCWSFTGHCPYFEYADCFKWKTGCVNCPLYKYYPISYFDNSKKMYKLKNKYFTLLQKNRLTIITPSNWLKNYTKMSFLRKYNVKTINNGIDLTKFKYRKSEFRLKHNLLDKVIILGVSMDWEKRKGLDYFIKLSKELDNKFCIVLVGTNDEIDKILPSNILSIHRTENQIELAKIYSACDVFVNPTLEDNFPTVDIEALSCGLPVITFDTGGSKEIINDSCGIIIEKGNYEMLLSTIKKLEFLKINKNNCIIRSNDFSSNLKFLEYYQLFKKICNGDD